MRTLIAASTLTLLVIGLLVGGYLSSSAGGQVHSAQPIAMADAEGIVAGAQKWPPKPQDIVNIEGYVDISDNFVINTFYPFSYLRNYPASNFYQVPTDRWLIITDVFIDRGTYNVVSPQKYISLYQVMNPFTTTPTVTFKLTNTYLPNFASLGAGGGAAYSSAVGLAFAPGSYLGFEHDYTSSGYGSFCVHITGYLAKP